MSQNAPHKFELSTQVYGDALLGQLKQGWAPLPFSTLLSMAKGGLKVRLMRSMVTMLSIVLAIAFLTYTGLTSYLQKNLVAALPKYQVSNPALPADVRQSAEGLVKLPVIKGLDLPAKLALARTMELGNTSVAQAADAGIAGQISTAQEQAVKAQKVADETAKNPKSLKSEIASAKSFAEKAKQNYEKALLTKTELAQTIALGAWVNSGSTTQQAELEPLLNKLLEERNMALINSLPNPSRLTAAEMVQLEAVVALAKAKGAKEGDVKVAEKAIADEYQKRQLVDLQSLMRAAGVSLIVTENAARMEVWLIVMALLTCAVGIANAMLMSVTERFREIGTMKCLGAQDNLVVKLFLLESAFLGIIGAIMGIILGVGVALGAALAQFKGFGLSEFPGASQCLIVILLSLAGGMFLSVGGAVYPAYSASRMRPVDALRVDE
jgi:ABC-type antimicrobial peptide transport system permease subunit